MSITRTHTFNHETLLGSDTVRQLLFANIDPFWLKNKWWQSKKQKWSWSLRTAWSWDSRNIPHQATTHLAEYSTLCTLPFSDHTFPNFLVFVFFCFFFLRVITDACYRSLPGTHNSASSIAPRWFAAFETLTHSLKLRIYKTNLLHHQHIMVTVSKSPNLSTYRNYISHHHLPIEK